MHDLPILGKCARHFAAGLLPAAPPPPGHELAAWNSGNDRVERRVVTEVANPPAVVLAAGT